MTLCDEEMNALAFAALVDAVDKLGGQAATARLLGIKQPSVWRWFQVKKPLGGEYVLKVEAATGISRHDLRPDLYPREPSERNEAPIDLEPTR